MKRTAALLLSVLLLAMSIFTSCKGSGTASSESTAETQRESHTAEVPSNAPVSDQKETQAPGTEKTPAGTDSEKQTDIGGNSVLREAAEYEFGLFDQSYIHTINVSISESDWADLLAHPTQKTKYNVDITIDGETVENVTIATKGNTSLSEVASSDSNRYSFKVNFGKNVDGQTYQGLKKLNLANMMADAAYMKDYLSYYIFAEAGVCAPLASYVSLSVNGELFGLYLAIEEIGKPFLKRYFGTKKGALYKPETSGGGGNGGGGGDLVYRNDNVNSYSAIFDAYETDITEEDKTEMVAALKALNTGVDVDRYWNMDQVIRYFAAHNFVINYDSYTGDMLHNYYLYENNGQVTVFPWDYNLAFGGYSAGDESTMINWPIDSPLSKASLNERPLWKIIVNTQAYLQKYHEVYDELLKNFFENGRCEAEITRVHDMLRDAVENDPSAFFYAETFDKACEMMKLFCKLRAESIRKQLSGTLGSTSGSQNRQDLVDVTGLDVSVMGTFGGGDSQGGWKWRETGNSGGNQGGNPGSQQPGGNQGGNPGSQQPGGNQGGPGWPGQNENPGSGGNQQPGNQGWPNPGENDQNQGQGGNTPPQPGNQQGDPGSQGNPDQGTQGQQGDPGRQGPDAGGAEGTVKIGEFTLTGGTCAFEFSINAITIDTAAASFAIPNTGDGNLQNLTATKTGDGTYTVSDGSGVSGTASIGGGKVTIILNGGPFQEAAYTANY